MHSSLPAWQPPFPLMPDAAQPTMPPDPIRRPGSPAHQLHGPVTYTRAIQAGPGLSSRWHNGPDGKLQPTSYGNAGQQPAIFVASKHRHARRRRQPGVEHRGRGYQSLERPAAPKCPSKPLRRWQSIRLQTAQRAPPIPISATSTYLDAGLSPGTYPVTPGQPHDRPAPTSVLAVPTDGGQHWTVKCYKGATNVPVLPRGSGGQLMSTTRIMKAAAK